MQEYEVNDARHFATALEDLINPMSFHPEAVAEAIIEGTDYSAPMHRALQQKFFELCVSYMFRLADANKRGLTDARNEYSAELAERIVKILGNNKDDLYIKNLVNHQNATIALAEMKRKLNK